MRTFIPSLKFAPALMIFALLLGATVASPAAAAASSDCQDLAWAYYYHYYQGNTAYAGQLLDWYNSAGC